MKKRIIWLTASVVALSCHQACAENVFLANAKALALGNAVTTDPPGIDAIHFNPAGLTLLDGRQYQLKFVAAPYVKIKHDLKRSDELNTFLEERGFEETIREGAETLSTSDLSIYLPFKGPFKAKVPAGPMGGVSYNPPGSRVTFGNSVYSTLAGGYAREDDSNARFDVQKASVMHLTYFAPTVAIKLNDEWSVGGGLLFNYTGAAVETEIRIPNPLTVAIEDISDTVCAQDRLPNLINLCDGGIGPFMSLANVKVDVDDPFTPSFNLGVLWQPTPWFSWGAVYQSAAKTELKGEYELTYSDEAIAFLRGIRDSNLITPVRPILDNLLPSINAGGMEGDFSLDLEIPQQFATGISVQLTPSWKVNFDLKWKDYEALSELDLLLDENLDVAFIIELIVPDDIEGETITLPRGYESVWSWAIGVEYQHTERLAFRFGYEPGKSFIPEGKADLAIPVGDIELYGLGFSYKRTDNSVFDFSVGYVTSEQDIPSNTSSNLNTIGPDNIVYNPYAGYDATTELSVFVVEASLRAYF